MYKIVSLVLAITTLTLTSCAAWHGQFDQPETTTTTTTSATAK